MRASAIALLLVAPLDLSAQTAATSFEALRTLVTPGETIYVTDASGRRTKGQLGELSASSLELLVRSKGPDGRDALVRQARLSEREVSQITVRRRDSLLNGTLIGFAPGAAIGALFLATGGGCDCYTLESRLPIAGGIFFWVGGLGAAIGAGVDALIVKRTTVYRHAAGRQLSRVRISPLLSQAGSGVRVSVGF